MAESRHSFEEHTGELRMRVEASSLPELFAEAARALAELSTGGELPASADAGKEAGKEIVEQTVRVEAPDRERLLVAWLDEMIFLTEARHAAFVEFRFERVTDEALVASVRGAVADNLRTVVKAATLHDLSITETPNGLVANLVLDV